MLLLTAGHGLQNVPHDCYNVFEHGCMLPIPRMIIATMKTCIKLATSV